MASIRDYAWAFSLTGGVIALIALLTPAANISDYYTSMYYWMWGLRSVQAYYYGSLTNFAQDPIEVSISLISSAIVLICIIGIILSASKSRKKMDFAKKKSWLSLSILLIIGTIIWMVGIEVFYRATAFGISFWGYFNPGFGIIGIFLGAGLTIIGYGVSKMSPRQPREVILPMKKAFPTPRKSFGEASEATPFKFCPNCGHKIVNVYNRFCTNCGIEFRAIPMAQFP
jgi:hypothetical protein